MNQREIAESVLTRVEKDKAYANLELSSVLKEFDDPQNNAFVSALVYGVLERKLTLDHIIGKYSSRRVRDIDIRIKNALRIGVYQLIYMDKVPAYSAIDESVELAKKINGKKSAGFVNAVLRTISSDKNAAKISISDEITGISRAYSVSADIVKLLVADYGLNETKSILKTTFGRPPVTIRVNTLKVSPDELKYSLEQSGVTALKNELVNDAFDISFSGDITDLSQFKEGLFHVQDAASQLCAAALGANKGERILDVCAAPGGKTFTVAQYMHGSGQLISCDIHSHRVKLIQNGAERLGLDLVFPIVNDASVYNEELGLFDRVLCDVPCSGTGVIRRKPEIRYKSKDEINELSPLQLRILETSSHYVKSGGVLLYSTCSVLSQENSAITSRFLEKHPDFERLPLFEDFDATEKTFLPHTDKTDGFYICKFIKK